jgi:hypothetical protein
MVMVLPRTAMFHSVAFFLYIGKQGFNLDLARSYDRRRRGAEEAFALVMGRNSGPRHNRFALAAAASGEWFFRCSGQKIR